MNIAAKIMAAVFWIALGACSMSAQSDVAEAARARNHESTKAQQEGDAKVTDAHAAASREINRAVMKQSLKQAKVDYREAIAKADRSLSDALEKCAMQAGPEQTACEIVAHSAHDQTAERAKIELTLADQ